MREKYKISSTSSSTFACVFSQLNIINKSADSVKQIKIKGYYSNLGEITLEGEKMMKLKDLIDEEALQIPYGSSIEISIAFDENDFLSGKDGIVWASYDQRQVDIIKNALLAQNVNTELKAKNLGQLKIFLLQINNYKDLNDAVDFIWKSKTGLRLQPDWAYPEGEANKSFEQWLGG